MFISGHTDGIARNHRYTANHLQFDLPAALILEYWNVSWSATTDETDSKIKQVYVI